MHKYIYSYNNALDLEPTNMFKYSIISKIYLTGTVGGFLQGGWGSEAYNWAPRLGWLHLLCLHSCWVAVLELELHAAQGLVG